ncbi:MAG: peptidoglycan-binding protein [Oscillospiraceae bacterium]|nr:peptidoglycan-binding protein [Oscillospiraceae bacterium]
MKKLIVGICLLALLFACALAHAEEAPTLRYNSEGEIVTRLQERLTELGYYSFRITGRYQENSQRAVSAFQQAHGLQVTGEADAALQALIFSESALPVPTPTPKPTPTPAPTLAPAGAFPGRLQYGSTGDDVRRIQKKLSELGFYHDSISGNYLNNTKNAVRDFQRHNGLASDGIVGAITWEMLFFGEALPITATPRPTPTPPPPTYRLEINVTNQVVSVYTLDEAGEYTQLVKHMICSTGTKSDPTALKTYTLNGATARWCYFPKWGSHAQYWTRMDASNAFHSVIYNEPNEMALATGSYFGLGERASHGCVRLMVADAKWIYDNCGKGTEVEVYEGVRDEELTKSLKIPPLDYSRMLPYPTAAPTPSPSFAPDAPPPNPNGTLSRGSENADVYWLQTRLTDLGYYAGSITGGYYAGTTEAVKAFQRDHGLAVDGQAGKMTKAKVLEVVLGAMATPEPTVEATPEPTPMPTVEATPEATPMPTATPEMVRRWFPTE